MSESLQPKEQFLNETSRWEAICQHNFAARDAFVYGVKTTGVYCRPGCASKQPNRANVLFFDSSQEAESAGFRPCKRCLPTLSADQHPQYLAIKKACETIAAAETLPRLETLAQSAGLSPYHFHRVFRQMVGITPRQYFQQKRLERFRDSLKTENTITGALYQAGYGTSSAFYTSADKQLGMKPTTYRQGGAGMDIRYAITQSYLGWVLVAATQRGICSVELGDSPAELEDRLLNRFPKANQATQDLAFQAWVEVVLHHLEAPEAPLDLPLDIQGTAFQQRVWQALRQIQPGTTATYTEIAEQIGAPKAVRAVAQACASNKLAVLIPCHRVIRSDGSLSGYRWGLERKRLLLDHERR